MLPYVEEEEVELLLDLLLSVDAPYDALLHRHRGDATLVAGLLGENALTLHFECRYEVVYGCLLYTSDAADDIALV